MEQIKQKLQQQMADRFENEFTNVSMLIEEAYALGLEDGALKAKAEIINLINGGQ